MSPTLISNGNATVKDPYGNYNPGDAIKKKTIYTTEIMPTVEGIVVDPVLYKGLEEYLFEGTLVPGVGTVLTWNWPGGIGEYRPATITALKIQRSSVSHSTPICQAGDGNYFPSGDLGLHAPPPPYGTLRLAANGPTIAQDSNWQTIYSSNAQFVNSSGILFLSELPITYTDADILTAPGHIFVYRLILLFTHVGGYFELDFNTVTIIKPYSLAFIQNGISWADRPSAAELFAMPGFGTLTLTKCTSGCWASLNWVQPVNNPAPDSYTLYKTVDGSTFEVVATNARSPFSDGQQPPIGITFRYKVVANLHDLSRLTSNIVSINNAGTVGT